MASLISIAFIFHAAWNLWFEKLGLNNIKIFYGVWRFCVMPDRRKAILSFFLKFLSVFFSRVWKFYVVAWFWSWPRPQNPNFDQKIIWFKILRRFFQITPQLCLFSIFCPFLFNSLTLSSSEELWLWLFVIFPFCDPKK